LAGGVWEQCSPVGGGCGSPWWRRRRAAVDGVAARGHSPRDGEPLWPCRRSAQKPGLTGRRRRTDQPSHRQHRVRFHDTTSVVPQRRPSTARSGAAAADSAGPAGRPWGAAGGAPTSRAGRRAVDHLGGRPSMRCCPSVARRDGRHRQWRPRPTSAEQTGRRQWVTRARGGSGRPRPPGPRPVQVSGEGHRRTAER